jgi:UDP-2,3-diacylglucosamine pyrophosphatase LpxH
VTQKKLKNLWNEMSNEFLKLEYVKEHDIPFKLDAVDGLEWAIRLTDHVSFKTIDNLSVWLRRKFGFGAVTFSHHALKEKAFMDRQAQFIVYGHTHHYEVIPLDSFPGIPRTTNQIYINSGTWHTYFDLAINQPKQQKFIPYQVLTYLTFYNENERNDIGFESWSGSFSD